MRLTKSSLTKRGLFRYIPPLSSVFLAISGVGFYTTFVSLYFANLNYNNIVIGVVQTSYFFGLLLGAYKCEQFVRRIGHIQVLAASGGLLAATTLMQALTVNLPLWVVTRVLSGMATAAFYVVIECWMLDHAHNKHRGRLLSMYMISLSCGYAFGQLLLHRIYDLNNGHAFIFASLLYALSVLPIALSTRKLTTPTSKHQICFLSLAKAAPFGTMGSLVSGFSISALYSFLALVPTASGAHGENFVGCMMIGGLVAQWPIGKCSDLFDRRKVLLALCLSTLVLYVIFVWNSGHSEPFLYLLTFCIGASVLTLYPLSVAQVIDRLQSQHLASATGCMLLIYSVGCTVGPLLASMMIQMTTDGSGLFLYLLIVMGFACVVGISSMLNKPSIPQQQQEDFVSLPRTTSLVYGLDPRVEASETDSQASV